MSQVLGVAVVGTGKMGLQHARAVREAGAELRALVDLSPASRAAARAEVPGVPVYETLDEAVRHRRIDAAHVCTPQRTHFAVARGALERGCHVFVEKPFVETGAHAQALYGLAGMRDLCICAGHQLLFEPAYRRLAAEMPLLGRVLRVESHFAFAPSRGAGGAAGLDPDEQMMDVLPHPLYLLLDALKRAAPHGTLELGGTLLGPGGTLHAQLRRGDVIGTLVVTLSGRPVASTLRVIGTGGELQADLVRGILLEQIGPGQSAIDKVSAPFLLAAQAVTRTTAVLARRAFRKQLAYPSLTELIRAWYASLPRPDQESPTPRADVLDTVGVFEAIVARTRLGGTPPAPHLEPKRPLVVVTGGTGWLGAEVTRRVVEAGGRAVVLARRAPGSWDRREHVEYRREDLSDAFSLLPWRDAVCVVHCAAETAGGAQAHERNSIGATRRLIDAMREAGLRRLVHVSSIAVLSPASGPVSEDSPLEPDPAACGPYTWGKTLSERMVSESPDVDARIVRPAAIVDSSAFVPPGKLGKRVGPLFVAVGGRAEPIGTVELEWTAAAIAWMALHFDEAPEAVNLLDAELPTRAELIRRVRASNPTLWSVRVPRPVMWTMGLAVLALSRVLRPGRKPIDVRRVFARQSFDNTRSRALAARMGWEAGQATANRNGAGTKDAERVEWTHNVD